MVIEPGFWPPGDATFDAPFAWNGGAARVALPDGTPALIDQTGKVLWSPP